MSIIKAMEVDASSLHGITKSTVLGSEFVSTMPNTGMPSVRASFTAMCSFITSTTKRAAGKRLKSAILPKFFSNLALWRAIWSFSRLERWSNVPSFSILSMVVIFFTALRIVGKFVSMPPGQRSETYGMLIFVIFSATISLACFFVATNRILRPDLAICFNAAQALSSKMAVLFKSIMWISLRSMKM